MAVKKSVLWESVQHMLLKWEKNVNRSIENSNEITLQRGHHPVPRAIFL